MTSYPAMTSVCIVYRNNRSGRLRRSCLTLQKLLRQISTLRTAARCFYPFPLSILKHYCPGQHRKLTRHDRVPFHHRKRRRCLWEVWWNFEGRMLFQVQPVHQIPHPETDLFKACSKFVNTFLSLQIKLLIFPPKYKQNSKILALQKYFSTFFSLFIFYTLLHRRIWIFQLL